MFDQAPALVSAQRTCESYAVPSETFPSASATQSLTVSERTPLAVYPSLHPLVPVVSSVASRSTPELDVRPVRPSVISVRKWVTSRKSAVLNQASLHHISIDRPSLASVTSAVASSALSSASPLLVNGIECEGLLDSSSTDSFIHPDLVRRH